MSFFPIFATDHSISKHISFTSASPAVHFLYPMWIAIVASHLFHCHGLLREQWTLTTKCHEGHGKTWANAATRFWTKPRHCNGGLVTRIIAIAMGSHRSYHWKSWLCSRLCFRLCSRLCSRYAPMLPCENNGPILGYRAVRSMPSHSCLQR